MSLSTSQMQQAVVNRDSNFDELFIYGVITTGIFCQPSCSSRQAKLENMQFYANTQDALIAGFKPCKRCQPLGTDSAVARLIKVARYIEEHAHEKLPLSLLGEIAELSPSRLQRVFKRAFGLSPKAYQDGLRMRGFKQQLKEGEAVTHAIFSAGFGSISRLYGEASRNIGMTPKAYRAGGQGEIISFACRESALGLLMMAATEKGVCFVEFGESEEALKQQLASEFPKAQLFFSNAQTSPELDQWIDALNLHISASAPKPELPLDIRGTAFQMQVWQFLLSVPQGHVVSYQELADQIDKPKAVRAAASACGKNRIGILIPCHRVLRSDGSLGGYRWGLERKRALLDTERRLMTEVV